MGQVTYIEQGGAEHVIEVADGETVMRGAVDNGVPGIDADCGGMCACATCHVSIAADWYAATGEPGTQEDELLELAPARTATSRLSCQIAMRPELDGLVVHLPESQH